MKIALIAHDSKKNEMVNFVIAYKHIFEKHDIYATGTTGTRIMMESKVPVNRMKSGPLGGDQQIGSMVASNEIDLVVFLRDPLVAQPHEPDIIALLRLCDVQCIPLATNIATAELLIKSMERADFAWRDVVKQKYKFVASTGTEG
ncbi:methylglyoxal synthase [Paenibacillus pinisoli]|uniref:Methylglyoxal synthase n=1 Tax=Paenibacillus pinisoli TaxID=1276110 RepID=A0A3A6PFI7_9BACL|nr:methylglyoxal synthase [Paenibacillus pinisoli]RJX39757.1 methylglyoxal synthase [Paenibacillus pinisoli]